MTTTRALGTPGLQGLGALHRRPAEEGALPPGRPALHRQPLRGAFASGACSPVAFAENLCRRHRFYDNAVFRGRQHRFCGADRDQRHRASAEPGSFIVEWMRDNRLSGQHIRQHLYSSAAPAPSSRRPRTPRPLGAVGVIIFNEGQQGRTGLPTGTLTDRAAHSGGRDDVRDGDALYSNSRAVRSRSITTSTHDHPDRRPGTCIADKKGNGKPGRGRRRPPRLGPEGRASTTTAAARRRSSRSPSRCQLKIKPRSAVRFAFWGAEESGLLGSTHYVDSLTADELRKIYAQPQLRHARLAELRPLRLRRRRLRRPDRVGPPGSAEIEEIFTDYFAAGPGHRADRVRRPLRLRAVHRRRHPGRRPVLRCGGHQDR